MSNTIQSVVIIGPAYPLRGGLAAFDERLTREFLKMGYQACIYTFSYQYPEFLFPGTSQFSTEPAPADLDIRVRINSINPLNWLKVGKELRRLSPDLIIVRYWLPFMAPALGTILRRIKKNKHIRIVCIVDNIIPHEKRPGDTLLTRYFVKPVGAFVTMSQKVLQQLHKIVPNKPVSYSPHPLYDHFGNIVAQQEAKKYLGIATDDQVLLFFGFIRKYKGLDLLLEAMKIVLQHADHPKLKLLIAGEFYENEKNYEDLLNDPLLAPHLILHTKFIPDSEVKYYLSSADCVVQPYRNATQSGVTPLAYHFEVPMIVTNVGGLPEMVPDQSAGLIAEPNPQSLAEKIEEYLILGKDSFLPGLREEKKKYTWKRMVEEMVQAASGNRLI